MKQLKKIGLLFAFVIALLAFTGTSHAQATSGQIVTVIGSQPAAVWGAVSGKQIVTADTALINQVTMYNLVFITKGTALAGTIVAPTVGTDDGKVIIIVSTTAAAHVITCSTDGFNAKGSSGTLTFTAAIGNFVKLVAYNGHWYVLERQNVTPA